MSTSHIDESFVINSGVDLVCVSMGFVYARHIHSLRGEHGILTDAAWTGHFSILHLRKLTASYTVSDSQHGHMLLF